MKKTDDIIADVLKRADSKTRDDVEAEWFDYMKMKLKFPFRAEINLVSYSAAVSDEDIVKVLALDDIIDFYGVIMKVKKGRKTLFIPLEKLELLDKKSKNHNVIDAFLDWYCNC